MLSLVLHLTRQVAMWTCSIHQRHDVLQEQHHVVAAQTSAMQHTSSLCTLCQEAKRLAYGILLQLLPVLQPLSLLL